jgi:hypothetical protein
MIRRLIRAYKLANALRRFDEQAEGEWSQDDAIALKTFLLGVSGKKLRARLSNLVFKSAIEACQVTQNGDYHRGIARGIYLTSVVIDNHFPTSAGQAGDSENQGEQEAA